MSDVFTMPPQGGLFGSGYGKRMRESDGESLDEVINRVAGEVAATVGPALADRIKSHNAATAKRETFAAEPGMTTHLTAIDHYVQNHFDFAVAGISLESHVEDFFINNPDANEPTAAVLTAVKKQSYMLNERWESGAVTDPWK